MLDGGFGRALLALGAAVGCATGMSAHAAGTAAGFCVYSGASVQLRKSSGPFVAGKRYPVVAEFRKLLPDGTQGRVLILPDPAKGKQAGAVRFHRIPSALEVRSPLEPCEQRIAPEDMRGRYDANKLMDHALAALIRQNFREALVGQTHSASSQAVHDSRSDSGPVSPEAADLLIKLNETIANPSL